MAAPHGHRASRPMVIALQHRATKFSSQGGPIWARLRDPYPNPNVAGQVWQPKHLPPSLPFPIQPVAWIQNDVWQARDHHKMPLLISVSGRDPAFRTSYYELQGTTRKWKTCSSIIPQPPLMLLEFLLIAADLFLEDFVVLSTLRSL